MKSIKLVSFMIGLLASTGYADEFSFTQHDLPMEMGRITKYVQFEDKTDLCLLDTGARKSTVRTMFSERSSVGQEPAGGLGGTAYLADLIPVKQITIDEWVTEDLVIRRFDRIPSNCIIGNDIFMKRNFFIDMTRKVFTTVFAKTGSVEPLKIFAEKWFGFQVNIAGETVDSIFDTGAGGTLVDPKLIVAFPENFEFVQKIDITDGADHTLPSAIYKMKEIAVADKVFRDVHVLSYPLDVLQREMPTVRVVLGFNVIRKQNWWFDFSSETWGAQ